MGDDGSGHAAGLRFPTVMINYQTGTRLKNYWLKKHEDGKEKDDEEDAKNRDIYLELNVQVEKRGKNYKGLEIVPFSVWGTSGDAHYVRLMRHMGVLLYDLQDLITFKPGIITWKCDKSNTLCSDKFKKTHCVSNG